MNKLFYTSVLISGLSAIMLSPAAANAESLLTGEPIGCQAVDYNDGKGLNVASRAFDGDLNTCYASYDRSYTWVGLDLGRPYVITKIGFSPRNDQTYGKARMRLGVFEGANSPDFKDALPLYIIPEADTDIGQMAYATVDCTLGFRYVRYVGPSDARCNVAEIEFYGDPGEGDKSHLYQLTNIPTVVINTYGKDIDNKEPVGKESEHELLADIKIISDGGAKLLDAEGTVRLRGNASMEFPKKPYRIKFDKKQNVLDAPSKAKKWTLINNYGDKSLLRNDVAFEIARRLGMEYVPYLRSVDVILNGEYKGNYQLCDQIEVREGRVDIEEMEPTDNEGDALTGGYLVEVDAYATSEPWHGWFTSDGGIPVTIKSPDSDDITDAQYTYIRRAFSDMEREMYNTVRTDTPDYHDKFDLWSFAKHFLVGEISGNTDTYWSTYMYKRRNDPTFYTGPVWDFDIAFENDRRTYPINSKWCTFIFEYEGASAAANMRNFVWNIMTYDKTFQGYIRSLWDAHSVEGTGLLSSESLNEYVDTRADLIRDSQALNFKRWPILSQYVHQNPTVHRTYQEAVDWLKKYITARIPRMNSWITTAYTPWVPSGVETPASGSFVIKGNGGEIAMRGFSAGSTFIITDPQGRTLASGEFDADKYVAVGVDMMCIVRVTDGATGSVVTRKFKF